MSPPRQLIFFITLALGVAHWVVAAVALRLINKTETKPNRTANFLLLMIHFLSLRYTAVLEYYLHPQTIVPYFAKSYLPELRIKD
jgi:hypothetical protein